MEKKGGGVRQLSEAHKDDSLVACVVRAMSGSGQAWEMLVEHYYSDIQRYLLLRTGHHEASQDLTQNTFLTAINGINRLRDPQAFQAWLFQIARNEWRMWLRQKSGRRLVSIDELTESGLRLANLAFSVDGIERLPERELILQIYAELPSDHQEALYLRNVAGFPDQEVAQILGISPTAAQKRAYRAEVAFRKRYDELSSFEYQHTHEDALSSLPRLTTSPATS